VHWDPVAADAQGPGRARNIGLHTPLSPQEIQETIMAIEPTNDSGARNLFIWASGFGLGALVVLILGIFLIGVGGVSHGPTAAQNAGGAPAQTTGSAPAQNRAAAPALSAPAQAPATTGPGSAPAPAQR
jgi:hypothetical protein